MAASFLRDHPELKPFVLSNVRLTGRDIGAGSYGSVEEVEIPGATCAAKKIHDIFQDRSQVREGEIRKVSRQFVVECQLMSGLRHPHIVQFLGVCFLPGSRLPALVMERLLTSLHDILDPETEPETPDTKPYIPLGLKCSILHNVAQGLSFLHSHAPPIIHRDLSARNVLLDSAMVAKIADLGMARIAPSLRAATMTKAPGASIYMPPEALEDESRYDMTIDIFSFGVLAIFILSQTFPKPLSATYVDARRMVVGRTELERRANYMQQIHSQLRDGHPLIVMIQRCLKNIPQDRPAVGQVVELLNEAKTEVQDVESDMNKLELVQTLREKTQLIRSNEEEVRSLTLRKDAQIQQLQSSLDTKIEQIQLQVEMIGSQQREITQLKQQQQGKKPVKKKKVGKKPAAHDTAATANNSFFTKEDLYSYPTETYASVPTYEQLAKEDIYGDPTETYEQPAQHKHGEVPKKHARYLDSHVYFALEDIYWAPASTVPEIYEQLSQHKYREIPRNQIRIENHLGSGQFGVVCKGTWQDETGQLDVAIKQVRDDVSEIDRVKFIQEAAIIGQFIHPNIVKLYGVVTVKEPLMIVLEYLSRGDLKNFLICIAPRHTDPTNHELPQLCLTFCQHVVSGMVYLAKKDFVHRDLAARNILVSENKVCKIADFGMARDLDESNYYVSHGGKIPTKWTAPEALYYKKYSTASDVWSFGCLMYEIWSLGHKPFEGHSNAQTLQLVSEGHRLAPPPGCPRAIYKLMVDCWHSEKSRRPTFPALHKTLSQDPGALLAWSVEDQKTHPQATVLGALLEAGKDLHFDIQETYITSQ